MSDCAATHAARRSAARGRGVRPARAAARRARRAHRHGAAPRRARSGAARAGAGRRLRGGRRLRRARSDASSPAICRRVGAGRSRTASASKSTRAALVDALARRAARTRSARSRASRGSRTASRAPSCARTGACAVDMESFWLAPAAAGRPFAVLRAVSDGPRHEFWRPAIVHAGIAALRRLRRAAPVLAEWAASGARSDPSRSEFHRPHRGRALA